MIHEQTYCIIIWQSPIVMTPPPPSSLSINCVVATIHILFCEIYKQITYYASWTDICIITWQSPIVITPLPLPLATIHLLFCEIYKHIAYYDPRTDFLYYNMTIPHRDDTPPSHPPPPPPRLHHLGMSNIGNFDQYAHSPTF